MQVVADRAEALPAIQISEMTVKMHRRQVMRKMQAAGVAQLVRLADQLGMAPRN